jgi:hypothetical protein
MAQTPQAQQHEQAERGQVGQAIPVHGHWPKLQGHRVNLRMNQHGGQLCSTAYVAHWRMKFPRQSQVQARLCYLRQPWSSRFNGV